MRGSILVVIQHLSQFIAIGYFVASDEFIKAVPSRHPLMLIDLVRWQGTNLTSSACEQVSPASSVEKMWMRYQIDYFRDLTA